MTALIRNTGRIGYRDYNNHIDEHHGLNINAYEETAMSKHNEDLDDDIDGMPITDHSSNEYPNPPLSTVYLTSGKGKRYQMTFRAKYPEFYFLQVRRRKSPEGNVNKASQACATDHFVEVRDPHCQRFLIRMKRYKIATCAETDTDSSADTPPTTVTNTSRHGRNFVDQSNQIYVEKDGLQFVLANFPVKVDIAQPIHESVSSMDSSIQTDFKRGTYNAEPNRASLVVRIRGDLLRIRFVLDELEIKPIAVYVSRAAQCSERYAYMKFQPAGAPKPVYCAVPLSTYRYCDPLIAIRKQNFSRRKQGLEPKWLAEQRRRRRATGPHGSGQTDSNSSDGTEANNSVIVFELNGHRVKLRCGRIGASVVGEKDTYDEFVLANKHEPRVAIKSPNVINEQESEY